MDDLHAELARLRAIAVDPHASIDEKVLALSHRTELITEQLEAVLVVIGDRRA